MPYFVILQPIGHPTRAVGAACDRPSRAYNFGQRPNGIFSRPKSLPGSSPRASQPPPMLHFRHRSTSGRTAHLWLVWALGVGVSVVLIVNLGKLSRIVRWMGAGQQAMGASPENADKSAKGHLGKPSPSIAVQKRRSPSPANLFAGNLAARHATRRNGNNRDNIVAFGRLPARGNPTVDSAWRDVGYPRPGRVDRADEDVAAACCKAGPEAVLPLHARRGYEEASKRDFHGQRSAGVAPRRRDGAAGGRFLLVLERRRRRSVETHPRVGQPAAGVASGNAPGRLRDRRRTAGRRDRSAATDRRGSRGVLSNVGGGTSSAARRIAASGGRAVQAKRPTAILAGALVQRSGIPPGAALPSSRAGQAE